MQLPTIQYKQRAPLPMQDASLPTQKLRSDIAVGGAIAGLAKVAGDIEQKYEWTRGAMETTNALSSFRNEYSSKKFYTADDVRGLGIEDIQLTKEGEFDEAGEPVERDLIPAHEVYPKALARKYKETIAAQSQKLSMPGARLEFTAKMQKLASKELELEVASALDMVHKNNVEMRLLDISQAKRGSNWAGVELGINSLPIPESERRELLEAAKVEEETEFDRDLVGMGDIDEIQTRAIELRDKKYTGPYSNDQREAAAQYLDASAKALKSAYGKQDTEVRKARLRGVWDELQQTLNPGLVAPWMDPKERTAILNFIDKNGKIETDMELWYKLERMAGTPKDQESFAEMDLYQFRDKLSTSDFQSLAAKQATIDQAGPELTSLRSFEAQFDDALRLLNIDPAAKPGKDDHKKGELLRRSVMAEVRDEEIKQKRKLDTVERQVVIDKVTGTHLTNERTAPWYHFGLSTKERVEFDVGDIPAKDLPLVLNAVKDAGLPMTTRMIYRVWEEGKKGK